MDGSVFQYTTPGITLGVKRGSAPAAPEAEDPALRLFRLLAQEAAQPLPPAPTQQSTHSDAGPRSGQAEQGTSAQAHAPDAQQNGGPVPGQQAGENVQTAEAAPSSGDEDGDSELHEIAVEEPADEEFVPVETTAPAAAANTPTTAAATSTAATINSAAEIEAKYGRRPYWMQHCKHIRSPLLRLHQEMVELTELLQPTPEEMEARKAAVKDVADIVTSLWPTAKTSVFGSFATGLYVPTSDIDLVITDSKAGNIQQALKTLATALTKKGVAHKMQVIGKARVPIIKFETVEYGGLAFDVSFDVANGPQAAELVKEFTGSWPMMRPLVLVLKLFLQQRELNEVYTGGIGSYALITMIGAFLQLHNSRIPKGQLQQQSTRGKGPKQPQQTAFLEPCLGVLIVDFFRLFGRVLNMREVGLASSGGGKYYRKDSRPDGSDWTNPERPYILSVEDPKDSTNDVCRNSYNIMRVKSAFEFAYQQLTAPSSPSESLLARILRLGAILVSRKRPTDLQALYAAMPGGRVTGSSSSRAPQQPQQQQQRGQKREREDASREEGRDGGGSSKRGASGSSRKEARGADAAGAGSSSGRGRGDERGGRGGSGRDERSRGSGSVGSSVQGEGDSSGSSDSGSDDEGEEMEEGAATRQRVGGGAEGKGMNARQQAVAKKAARKRQKKARKERFRVAMAEKGGNK